MDPAYQLDESFAWFVPGKRGDHDLKFGASIVHTPLHIYDASTLNGAFGFSASDADFNAANPRTYPDRLTIRVPSPSDYIVTGTYYGVFVQDKWKINNHLTASLGVRWDAEILPIEEKDNPKFASPDDYPLDLNNFAPRFGLTWAVDEAGTSVIRGGWGQFYQKTPFAFLTGVVSSGVFSDSFTVSFPANNIDPGPSAGTAADRSLPRQRPGREPRAAQLDVPGGHAAEEHRHGAVRQSQSHGAVYAPGQRRLREAVRHRHGGERGLHPQRSEGSVSSSRI